jgi:hypothetical protein
MGLAVCAHPKETKKRFKVNVWTKSFIPFSSVDETRSRFNSSRFKVRTGVEYLEPGTLNFELLH